MICQTSPVDFGAVSCAKAAEAAIETRRRGRKSMVCIKIPNYRIDDPIGLMAQLSSFQPSANSYS
jgi:hypothetical protein